MSREEAGKSGRWYSVIDGTFRVQVNKDDPDAVMRDWKTPDGKSGTKWERVVKALHGIIEGISVIDGDYGKNINIFLDKNEDTGETPVVSLSAASRYGEDFLKKLPNVDLTKEVRIRPFSFKGDEDKEIRGVELTQRDDDGKFTVKLPNFFWDSENKKPLNGYPPVDKKEDESWDNDEWKGYYAKARKFLIAYAEENVIPKLKGAAIQSSSEDIQYPDEEINPEDIPF